MAGSRAHEVEVDPEQFREDEERAMDEVMEQFYDIDDDPRGDGGDGGHGGHGDGGRRRTSAHQRQWQEAQGHARTRIYEGSRLSRLSAIMLLLNLQQRHGASNLLLDDLFHTLHDRVLPPGNQLPSSWKEAKKVLKSMGLKYQVIHACVDDCVLFRGEHESATRCPVCDKPRYREDTLTGKVPMKVMRYFPLIPRLRHQYRCAELAEYMVWHSQNRSNGSVDPGVMRMCVDSPVNKFVEERWPDFKLDPRHVRLGLAADGISPFALAGKAQPYSVWPVVLTNYNIPPWMAMKKGHLLLSMIIPGPKQVKKIDVYLQPLLDELKQLWEGVDCYDGRERTGGLSREFKLKAILMWTMHDLPGMYVHTYAQL
jgi:Transposase family tnp2